MSNENSIETLLKLGRPLIAAGEVAPSMGIVPDVPFAAVPNDVKLVSLEEYRSAPTRIRCKPTFDDLESFLAYVARFRCEGSVIFVAHREHPQVTKPGSVQAIAVFDYSAPASPNWHQHTALFSPKWTDDWNTWSKSSGSWFTQEIFAAFIERNWHNIVTPSHADMIEIARCLEAKIEVDFRSAVRLQSGDRELRYESRTTAKAGEKGVIAVPEKICLGIPLWKGEVPWQMSASLRYKISDGKLTIMYEIDSEERIVAGALDALVASIKQKSGLPVFIGTP